MRVLVTRPEDDARYTAGELASRGHEAVIAPIFSIRFFSGPEPSLDDTQAILATSGNGIRAMAGRSARRDVPVLAVGAHTAAAAHSAGFRQVFNAQGDSVALTREVIARLPPEGGALLLLAGTNASPDLPATLERAGFRVRICVLYDTVAVPELPGAALEALRSETLDAALLFSPRSARLLVKRVREAALAAACRRLIACCISESTAQSLDGLEFARVRVAERPDQEALLALLGAGLPSLPRRA